MPVEIYPQQFGTEVADRVCSELQSDGPVTRQATKVYASHHHQDYAMQERHGAETLVPQQRYQGVPSQETQPWLATMRTPQYLPVISTATQKPTMDCPK